MTFPRLLGLLWCSPLSLLGALVAFAGGARFRCWMEGELHLVGDRFILRRFFALGFSGYAWGAVVVFASNLPEAHTVTHERWHVVQAMILGVLMPVAYVLAGLLAVAAGGHFYRDNAFELLCRTKAGQTR